MKKYMILILLLLIPLSARSQFKGRWKSGANAPTAEHTTVKVDTLEELTSSHGVVMKSDLKTLANVVFEMGASEEISLTDNTDTYYVLVSSDALTFQNDAGTPVTLATLDSTGLMTVKGNAANAAKILLSLVNSDEQASGETNQTSEIYFYTQGTSNGGTSFSNAPTARIKAGKASDYFNASGTADNDGLLTIQVPNAGTLRNAFTANYYYTALEQGSDAIYWDGTALYCTDDSYDLGKTGNRFNEAFVSDNIMLGGKGQTSKLYISQENTIAGTDSSIVGWVDDGNGKLETKSGDADSLVMYTDNSTAYVKSNNPIDLGTTAINLDTLNVDGSKLVFSPVQDSLYIVDLKVDGTAIIDELNGNGGQIYGEIEYDAITFGLDTPSSLGPDTLWFFKNHYGADMTIDSIHVDASTDDQDLSIVSRNWGGGGVTLVDAVTASTDGTNNYYSTETTISDGTISANQDLGIVKPSAGSTSVEGIIYYHYTKQKR